MPESLERLSDKMLASPDKRQAEKTDLESASQERRLRAGSVAQLSLHQLLWKVKGRMQSGHGSEREPVAYMPVAVTYQQHLNCSAQEGDKQKALQVSPLCYSWAPQGSPFPLSC